MTGERCQYIATLAGITVHSLCVHQNFVWSLNANRTFEQPAALTSWRRPMLTPRLPTLGPQSPRRVYGIPEISTLSRPSTPRCTSPRVSTPRSGTLDRGATAYRIAYGELPYRTWSTPDSIFSVIDTDGSGRISIGELSRFFRRSPFDVTKLDDLFRQIDADGSGEISREEWRRGFYEAGFDGSSGVVGQSVQGFGVLLSLVKPSHSVKLALSELHLNRPPIRIPRSEERGITLPQLRQLWAHVNQRCHRERWSSVHGDLLDPNTITMYEVIRYVVKPCTLPATCSYVERCLGDRPVIPPTWTVLHWWGDSLRNLLTCIEQHARDRGVCEESASYWIAAFSLSQHQQEMDLQGLHGIPRAIALSVTIGTLVVIDPNRLAFKRLWVMFEAFVAATTKVYGRTKLLDIYTPLRHLSKRRLPAPPVELYAVGLTDGCTLVDAGAGPTGRGEAVNKVERENHFPVDLVDRVLEARTTAAHTSMEVDKRAILNLLTSQGVEHSTLESVVGGRFALAALRRAFDEGGTLLRRSLNALRSSQLTHVVVNLSDSRGFNVLSARELAKSLPATIQELSVHFSGVPTQAADAFLIQLAEVISGESDGASHKAYSGRTPQLARLCLVSDAITAEGGYCLGTACGRPPCLTSIDWGLPAPFESRVASAIVAVRHEGPLSYVGTDRFVELSEGFAIALPGKGLTTSDLILLLASASRGVPSSLTSLDLSNNDISPAGLEALDDAISSGRLPDLKWINLSRNPSLPQSAKESLLKTMRQCQASRTRCHFRLANSELRSNFEIIPTSGSAGRRGSGAGGSRS